LRAPGRSATSWSRCWCTCPRWERVTGRLIAAIESCELLAAGDLDELAEAFLADEAEIVYPVGWVCPEWQVMDLDDPSSAVWVQLKEDTPAHDRRRITPPLRRWAGRRALDAAPERLDELLITAERLGPHDRGALLLGVLDAAAGLGETERRMLVGIGLETGIARVRRAALDVLAELDGAEAALTRARCDGDATVRRWKPRELSLP
jgi:hypothetical protein